ncbi:hypothetical protein PENTCL1PPCAC_24029, partial [Pristionchus entomophagus]
EQIITSYSHLFTRRISQIHSCSHLQDTNSRIGRVPCDRRGSRHQSVGDETAGRPFDTAATSINYEAQGRF